MTVFAIVIVSSNQGYFSVAIENFLCTLAKLVFDGKYLKKLKAQFCFQLIRLKITVRINLFNETLRT